MSHTVQRNRHENRICKPIKAAIQRFQADCDSIFLHSTKPSVNIIGVFVAGLPESRGHGANKTSPAMDALPSNEANREMQAQCDSM